MPADHVLASAQQVHPPDGRRRRTGREQRHHTAGLRDSDKHQIGIHAGLILPRSKQPPHNHELAEMVGIVVGHEQRFA